MANLKASTPSVPLKTRISTTLVSTVLNILHRHDDTVNRSLHNLLIKPLNTSPNPNPINGVKTYDVTVDPSHDLWFRVYVPTTASVVSNLPVLVYYHGGGFIYLSARSKPCDDLCRTFSREFTAIVVSVEYRLAPEHRYPTQYVDGLDVLKFLDTGNDTLPENADLGRCFLVGDSAGGNIAHHVAKEACTTRFEKLKVIGLVAIQPFFGGEERTESEKGLEQQHPLTVKHTDHFWRAFLPAGEKLNRDHNAINVTGPEAAELSTLHFPATLLVVGGFDVLQDWQRRYYEMLKNSEKEVHLLDYPNMFHGFYLFSELPEYTQLLCEIKEFIDKFI